MASDDSVDDACGRRVAGRHRQSSGDVPTQTSTRHRAAEVLDFPNLLVGTYPRRELHLVLDNVSTYRPPDVQTWLARHRRAHRHFTPTPRVLGQVVTWFSILSRHAIRRGSFERVRAPVAAIKRFTREWSTGPPTIEWVKTDDEILAKAVRNPQATSGAGR